VTVALAVATFIMLGVSLATILWKMAASDARNGERQDNIILKLDKLEATVETQTLRDHERMMILEKGMHELELDVRLVMGKLDIQKGIK